MFKDDEYALISNKAARIIICSIAFICLSSLTYWSGCTFAEEYQDYVIKEYNQMNYVKEEVVKNGEVTNVRYKLVKVDYD